MRAAVIDRLGPPEVLRLAEVDVPEPGPGEVLVRVEAIGVNAIDWASRAGQGVPVEDFPAVLGWDVCGSVVSGGPGLPVGRRVFGMPRFPALAGAYAEYLVAPADQLVPVPPGVDAHTAAAVPMVGLTAWLSLFGLGGLRPGQRVLVHGAAGGVGHVAVQLARSVGAEVTGTASAGSREFVAGLGAAEVVDYAAVGSLAERFDVVLDPRGGPDFATLLGAVRPGGVIVTLKGESPGQRAQAAAAGVRAEFTYVAPDRAALGRLAELLGQGRFAPVVDRVLPLADVAVAHELGERGHVHGRLVLDAS